MTAEELIDYQRKNRDPRAVGSGSITDPQLLAELLTSVLDGYLERTAPRPQPARMVSIASGWQMEAEKPAAAVDLADADDLSRQLATLIGHLLDAHRGR